MIIVSTTWLFMSLQVYFLFLFFSGVPHLDTCIFLFFYNEPELGVGIDAGMDLTPLPSSIGQGLNPRPSDCEPSALPLDHDFRLKSLQVNCKKLYSLSLKGLWIFPQC